MKRERDIDPHADAALKAWLGAAAPEPPVDDVDWQALHARITDRAVPLLRRQRGAWWQLVAGWSPRSIPAAATAAAALLLVLATGVVPPARPIAAVTVLTLEEELAAESAALLAAGDDADAVLDALLFYDMEDE
jgi:hypothetical protein